MGIEYGQKKGAEDMRPNSPCFSNPQALRAVSKRAPVTGDPLLINLVDPDTWLTPRWILSQLGHFDLDPCAAHCNPEWVGAKRSYQKSDDGLISPWTGRVFCNPPFSNTPPWLEKHSRHGFGISLVPCTLESKTWAKFVWPKAVKILLLSGRVRFCNPDGSTTTGRPLRPVCLIAWSDFDAEMLAKSGYAGVLLERWRV